MRNIKHTLPVSLVLAIVIVILASVISMNKIENQEKQDISIYLNTILGTTHQGFRSWADRHKKNCRIWANEMLPLAEELLKVEPTNEELLKSEAEHRIRERLKPFYSGDDYEGFFLINRDNISIASSRDSNTGTLNVLVQHPDLLKRMWAGETVLTLPIASDVPLPGHGGVLVEERSTMFVGTPVKDKTGKIIALFALRINPNDNYTAIFERAQLGETRETYCVSDSGQMISHSRFRDWMENAGVVRPGESEILNVNVAVPSQHAQGTQLDSEPEYTEAAQSLMRGESKVNLKGYKNYTGDIVIGAWTWDYEYGFGIASEISKHEAFTGIRNIRFTVIALAVLIIALLVGMFNLFQWLNRKLADSERKYRIFFDNSPLGIYQSTPEGSIINANPALIKMLEFDSLSELKNRNLNEEGYDASSDVSREQFVEQIEKDNYIKGLEGVWKTKNGRSIYIRENARIVRNPDGTKYYDGIVEDISEKREAEEKIRRINEELERIVKKRTTELEVANLTLKKEIEIRKKAEERIRLIFNSSPYSAMLVDSDGTIHIANTMTEEYFGYNSAQFIGANIKMLIPEEEKLFKASYTDTDFEDPESIKMGEGQDLFARKADGKQFPVEVSLTPIEYDGEKMVLANIIDITKRIESEERIRKAKLEAERANHAKSEFLSRMSHEFRTPMNSILGFAQLLDMGEMDKKFKKNIRQILKNGKHLLELINEVLDIARIETNQISLSLEAIDVSNVINEVLDILNPLAYKRHISMKTNNVDYFLIADYQRLKQVLLNLINNAIKYNKPNGFVETTCDLISNVADGSGDWVRISITDSGKGIAEENLYKVFEPFERVGAEITEIEGSGLGLSIVKKLVDAMGGKVGVASELGKGTTFWLELPLADNPANQIQQHDFISGKINAPSQKVGNLLYIEDNSSNIDLMVQVLEEYRPSVNLITNMYGKNTVQFAKDYSPFLILLDLNLPDIHGYEIVKLLKADMKTKDIPVVIVSADAMEKQVKRLMDEGVQGYLTKPVDIEQLLDIIDKNLNV